MKKFFLSILLILLVAVELYSLESRPFPQVINGYVNADNYLLVTLDNTVLPFNLLSETVAKNNNPNVVTGIRIGTLTFSSNDDNFSVNISHDKLKSDSLSDNTELDYRLDVFYHNNTYFVSCYSDVPVSITKSTNTSVFVDDTTYYAVDQNIYVSMNEETSFLESNSVAEGTYSSTITITISILS